MELWERHLIDSFTRLNDETMSVANRIFRVIEGTISGVECGRCQWTCYDADALHLDCGHGVCFDCVDDQLERLVGFFERHQSYAAELYQPALCRLLICSTCHRLYVLKQSLSFHAAMQSKDRGWLGRGTFSVDAEATEMVEGEYTVWCHFENARRGLFGCFLAQSLYRCERSAKTRLEGELNKEVPFDEEALNRELESRNAVWLEEWRYDPSIGNQQGWQYAFNWPTNGGFCSWKVEPSFWKTFVRRRRMLRVSITKEALERLAAHVKLTEKNQSL